MSVWPFIVTGLVLAAYWRWLMRAERNVRREARFTFTIDVTPLIEALRRANEAFLAFAKNAAAVQRVMADVQLRARESPADEPRAES